MKVTGYKVLDAGGTISAAFLKGKLDATGATLSKNWPQIPAGAIVAAQSIAAVAADVAWTQNVVFATAAVAGEKFTITISSPDSRQKFNKRFTYYAVGADTAEVIEAAFIAAINASDALPITASNGGAGTVTLTADTAGTGINYIVTAGTNSATTTVTPGAVTADAQLTDAAFFAAKFDNVDTADFGDLAADYAAISIKYKRTFNSAHSLVGEYETAVIFYEAAATVTALLAGLNGTTHDAAKQDLLDIV
jgi:hypothetical protein